MVQPELTAYIKESLAAGHAKEAVKSTLISQGWSDQAVNEALLIASAPLPPQSPTPLPASTSAVVPDYYNSPLSVMLAFLLFFALYAFTNTFILDVNAALAPALHNSYQTSYGNSGPKNLFITGIISIVFWGMAFAIHLSFGEKKRQFLVLSMPYFVVAGIYLLILLADVFSKLFAQDQTVAVYGTLLLVIIVITGAFVVYQKRNHNKSSLI